MARDKYGGKMLCSTKISRERNFQSPKQYLGSKGTSWRILVTWIHKAQQMCPRKFDQNTGVSYDHCIEICRDCNETSIVAQ